MSIQCFSIAAHHLHMSMRTDHIDQRYQSHLGLKSDPNKKIPTKTNSQIQAEPSDPPLDEVIIAKRANALIHTLCKSHL